jgi:biotin operon repressor
MEIKNRKELSLSGMFYRMRDNWIRHVIGRPKKDYSPVSKLVAIRIATAINPETRSWVISQARIAADLEVGERIVKQAVAQLKKDGLIKVKRVKVPGKAKLFNAYEIVPVELAEPV